MIGARVIAKTMKEIGVNRVYVYPGGVVTPLLNELIEEGIDYICPKNEQGVGYAAIGAAKTTNFPQVVIVTSGPGATNVLTPVADAYYDSIPLLVITGQVSTKDINFKKKVRQTGFQEIDTISIFKSVTKKAKILTSEDDISDTIRKSFYNTKQGRPGPVLIDLPMDVQMEEAAIEYHSEKDSDGNKKINKIKKSLFNLAIRLMENSERPLILAGNGIYCSESTEEFREFVKKTKIPVVSSLPAMGVLPSENELNFSFIGHTGEYFANLAFYNADLVLSFGSRLDLRQTGTELDHFKNKKLIRVDIDENELNFGRIKGDLNIHMDLKDFFQEINKRIEKDYFKSQWIDTIKEWKNKYHSSQFYKNMTLTNYDIIKSVNEFTKDMRVIVSSGVGGHQQMAARYFSYDYPDRIWLTSAGHGTMGYDVPTIIGAVLENKKAIGIVFVGDGSVQMNIQELATIKEHNLPVKIFVMNNRRLGVVSQFQLSLWKKDPTTGNKINPSFHEIAKAYKLNAFEIKTKDDINKTLKEAFKDRYPALIECHIDYDEDTLPLLKEGQKMNEMYPFKAFKEESNEED